MSTEDESDTTDTANPMQNPYLSANPVPIKSHALTNIMPIQCLSEDVCASNQGTSILCPPTTSLHGRQFHMSIQSSIGNGHANTRPIRVGSPTYLKEQVVYGANYSQDAIIFEPRPGLAATSISKRHWTIKYRSCTTLTIHGQSSTIHCQSVQTTQQQLSRTVL